MFRERRAAKVTIKYCQKRLPFLRQVSRQTTARVSYESGLRWLRRRVAILVPTEGKDAKPTRLIYAEWILARLRSFSVRIAYTDGTTFHLARSAEEQTIEKRLAMGKLAWGMSGGKDGLWDENVSPSLYAASQGLPATAVWSIMSFHATAERPLT